MSIDNKILMLSLILESSTEDWLGITKLMKLSFLTEFLLSNDNERAFDYEFFIYDLGPISTEVYNDFEFLLNEELVIEDENGIRLSEHGKSIEKQFRDLIPKEISSAMRNIVNRYASMKTHNLVEIVHKMKVKLPDGTVTSIEDLPKHFIILHKPLDTLFKLSKAYCETFRILSDKSLVKAIQEARRKGVQSEEYKPLSPS